MDTYLETCGAITLHGPHQVAKQSRTTMSCFRASSKAILEVTLWTPILEVVVWKVLDLVKLTIALFWSPSLASELVDLSVLVSFVLVLRIDEADMYGAEDCLCR